MGFLNITNISTLTSLIIHIWCFVASVTNASSRYFRYWFLFWHILDGLGPIQITFAYWQSLIDISLHMSSGQPRPHSSQNEFQEYFSSDDIPHVCVPLGNWRREELLDHLKNKQFNRCLHFTIFKFQPQARRPWFLGGWNRRWERRWGGWRCIES